MAIIGPGIQIFSGANSGAGGGTVNAAINGVTLISPTTVGLGSPMTLPTQIGVPSGTSISFISFDGLGNDASWGVHDLIASQEAETANGDADIITSSVGGVLVATFGVTFGGNFQGFVITDGGTIAVADANNNVGMIGNALYPNSDPNQYAQYGNILVFDADNGLHPDGGFAKLGGLLIEDTEVDTGPDNNLVFQSTNNPVGHGSATWQLLSGASTFSFTRSGTNNQSFIRFEDNSADAHVIVGYSRNSGGSKNVDFTGVNKPGIPVEDTVDEIGLIGTDLFAVSDPKQYAQYGNILGNSQLAKTEQLAQSVSALYPLYNLPVGTDQFVEVIVYLVITIAGVGVINVNVNFTDSTGAQSFNVGTKATVGSMQAIPVAFKAIGGSPIGIDVVVSTPGFVFDIGAVVNLQFNN